ncbi:MAG: hypothetical protein JNJ45_11020 [Chthonomonas sp.]|nr:hypothetical protein [Chthonomonas sp.]
MIVADRLAAKIARHGEAVTIDGTTAAALISVATPSQSSAFMAADSAYLVTRPIYHALVLPAVAAVVNDGVVWAGETYEVHHVHPVRWDGAVVAKVVLFS